MSDRFDGRNVIVTGGGRGIGQATARAFAREGANVLVLGRTAADLESTVSAIEAATAGARGTDLRRPRRGTGGRDRGARRRARRAHPRARQQRGHRRRHAVPRDRPRALARHHRHEPHRPVPDVARGRAAHGGERRRGDPAQRLDRRVGRRRALRAYNASKAGLLGLNRTMALELAEHGIRSNCVSPGLHPHGHDREGRRAEADGLPERLVRARPDEAARAPDEIAQAFLFLASDAASAITGSTCASTAASPRTGSSSRRCPRTDQAVRRSARTEVAGWRALRLENGALAVTCCPTGAPRSTRSRTSRRAPRCCSRRPGGSSRRVRRRARAAAASGSSSATPAAGRSSSRTRTGAASWAAQRAAVPRRGRARAVDVGGRAADADELAVRFEVTCRTLPLRLARTMRLAAGSRRLLLDETVTNLSDEPVHFVWGHHCVLGPPLVAAGARLERGAHDRDDPRDVGGHGAPGARAAQPVADARGARRRGDRPLAHPGAGGREPRRRVPDRPRRRLRRGDERRASGSASG